MVKREDASLTPLVPMTLGVRMSPCRANSSSRPSPSLPSFSSYRLVDSVISQLDKLVRGSSGEA